MLQIGEFSALTGLTVKALRHYDEQGLLAPARVDETSGRRFYAPRQIRDALTILSLREADIPLPVIARVLGSPGDLNALEQQRERVLRERRRHDAAFDAVLQTFAEPPAEVAIARRDAPERAFWGYSLHGEPDARDAEGHVASDLLASVGVDVAGPHWVTTRVRDHEAHDVTLCWPVTVAAGRYLVPGLVSGVLPARTEIYAGRRTDAGGLQDLGWYAEALTRLVEALADEHRPHREGFLMRYEVRPGEGDCWDTDLSIVV